MRTLAVLATLVVVICPQAAMAASKTDAIADTVADVLRRELTEDLPDRAASLRPVLEAAPRHSAAHWASGDVQYLGQWQSSRSYAPTAVEAERLVEYRVARDRQPLTLERHRELADWCHAKGLFEQERAHVWQMLQQNPAEVALWKRLNYVPMEGRWVSPEQAALIDEAAETYAQNFRLWRTRAASLVEKFSSREPGHQEIAHKSLSRITDPTAIPAMELALTTSSADQSRAFIAWVRRFDELPATLSLARQAVLSPWQDVRELAIDGLRGRPWETFIPSWLDLLAEFEVQDFVNAEIRQVRTGDVLFVLQSRRELRDVIETRRQVVILGRPLQTIGIPGRGSDFRLINQISRETAANDALLRAGNLREAVNESIVQSNPNPEIETALRLTTGVTDVAGPQAWWQWWAARIDSPPLTPAAKLTVEVTEITPVRPAFAIQPRGSCLPAGSLVQTEIGPRPIETIQPGDKVLSKDVESGELAYRAVLKTTFRRPQPLVRLSTADETIEATRGHHFWVSGKGWRMAREIQPGDRLHGVKGTIRVTDVATGDMAEVYNLVVDRANTYFVGESLVLSHDVTLPTPTDVKVPGLAAK